MLEFTIKVIGYVTTGNTPCEILSPWQMWCQLQDDQRRDAGPNFQVQTP